MNESDASLRVSAGIKKKKTLDKRDTAKGVTTPNVKNRTLRNLDHSFGAAKGRRA
jgi:hypothetical protein